MKTLLKITIALAALFSGACIQVIDFNPSGIEKADPIPDPGKINLKSGETKSRQIWMWFGSPTQIQPSFQGEKEIGSVWVYSSKDPGNLKDSRKQDLWKYMKQTNPAFKSNPEQIQAVKFFFDETNTLKELSLE